MQACRVAKLTDLAVREKTMARVPIPTSNQNITEETDQTEGLEDLREIDPLLVQQVVVNSTDWTVETLISQINKGNIELNPIFQRRDAWTATRKSAFIESLILGLPIPQIVLAERRESRGRYIVIDGKQRLLSLRQFVSSENDLQFERFSLIGLSVRPDLNNVSYDVFSQDGHWVREFSGFENQTIRTIVIKNWQDERVLYQIFLRLNTGSVPLSPQELRQALHPGPFVQFVDENSAQSPALRFILGNPRPDFRMRDAEILVRYFAFRFFGNQYRGNLKRFLDETCETLNRDWPQREADVLQKYNLFEEAVYITAQIFETNAFRKWKDGRFENLFNRAVFDIMVYYFSIPEVASKIVDRESEILAAFVNLSRDDYEFIEALETTTKSLRATRLRFERWRDALARILGVDIPVPVPELAAEV
jgi:hypothetical protein